MTKGKTKSGFDFKVRENISEDARVAWYVALTTDSDSNTQMHGMRKLLQLITGSDSEYERLLDHVASKNNGSCPISVVNEEIAEIIAASNTTKN